MPLETVDYQDAGDFRSQRAQFRSQALRALRRREGLTGRPDVLELRSGQVTLPYATGAVKGEGEYVEGRILPSALVDLKWSGGGEFDILSLSEDGVPLENELRDLWRDADGFIRGAQVTHGSASVPWPVRLENPDDDEEVLALIERQVNG